MYFVFVTAIMTNKGLAISVLTLPLHAIVTFENEAKLYLWAVLDSRPEAEEEEKRLHQKIEQCADSGTPLAIDQVIELHFIWLTCAGPQDENDPNEEAEIILQVTYGGITAELESNEDFAVVLSTLHEDQVEELVEDPDEIQRRVYGEAEENEYLTPLPIAIGEA